MKPAPRSSATGNPLHVLLPALLALGLPVMAVLALAGLPVDRYWIMGYEGLHFDRIWPWLMVLAAACIPLAGAGIHARQGRPLHLPGMATLAILTMLLVSLHLATTWSLGWHAGMVWFSVLPLAGASLTLALGHVAFSEVWRRVCNGSVVRTLTGRLGPGRLPALRIVPERSRYARGRPWGSPHRLAVLRAHYLLTLARVHSVDSPYPPEEADLRRLFRAGAALVECLLRRWPQQGPGHPRILGLPERAQRREINLQVLVDMIAVGLERLRAGQGPADPSQDALADELRQVLPQWMEALEVLAGPQLPGLALVRRLVRAGLDGSAATRGGVAAIVEEARNLPAPTSGSSLTGCCPALWLVVVPDEVPGDLVHDVWRELSQRIPRGPTESAPSLACEILQTQHLWRLVDRRLLHLPPSQRPGVERQKVMLQETAARLQERVDLLTVQHGEAGNPAEVTARAGSEVPSWPYWEVRRTPAVRRLVGGLAALILAPLLLALLVSNPYVSPLAANTVDHVQDPRWYRPDPAGDWFDLAHSGRWLALASREGDLTLFNTRSRLPRQAHMESPARDVAGGMQAGSFLAITRDQGIEEVTPGTGPLGSQVDLENWLPAPERWGWPGPGGFDTRAVLASLLDERGWLLAVRGRGLARYVLRREPNGRRVRSRSWQYGSSPHLDLDQVALTLLGAWYSEGQGGLGFAALDTLDPVGGRSVPTPPIRRLDANFNQDWASATDQRDGLWLFDPSIERWAGAFFGHVERRTTLKSLDSVRAARRDGGLAWLGAREGLFAYDLVGRRLHPALPGFPSTALEPRSGSDAGTTRAVLAGGSAGLVRVSVSAGSDDFQTRRLDSIPVTSLALGEDSSTAAWIAGGKSLKVLQEPFGEGQPATWVPASKGPRMTGSPTVLDARRAKEGLLLLTRAGVVYYQGSDHTYRDASRTRVPAVPSKRFFERVETLKSLDDVDVTEGRLAILGDGRPHLLQEDAAADAPLWQALDPLRLGRPVQVAQAGGQVFGLGADGRLLRYQGAEVQTFPATPGGLPRLESPRFQTRGDMFERSDQTWRLSFVHEDRLYTYDSKSGSSRSQALAGHLQGRVSQVRLVGEDPFLLADHRVFSSQGEPLFGFGSLPFAPAQVSALSPGADWQTLLVGGPEGRVLQYRWNDASWRPVGGRPLPVEDPRSPVEEVLQTSETVLARAEGQVFRGTPQGWAAIPDCRRAAFPLAGLSGWGLFGNHVQRMDARSGRPEGPRYCTGLTEAHPRGGWRAAWQDESGLVLLSGEGSYASYEPDTDSWSSGKLQGLKELDGFTPWQGGMMVLQGKSVLRIVRTPNGGRLQTELFATAPGPARGISLASSGSKLRMSYLHGDDVVIREWDHPGGLPGEFRRRQRPIPEGFQAADVVAAAPAGRGAFLFDSRGACASYDPLLGRWGLLRRARPGQTVFAWVSSPRPALVLRTQDNRTHTLRTLPDLSLSERVYDMPPEKVLARLEWEGCTWQAPGEGTLLETGRLRVTRRQGQTLYEAGADRQWMPLHLKANGFAEDQPTTVLMTPSGTPWVLAGEKLFQVQSNDASKGLAFTGRVLPGRVQAAAALAQVEIRTVGPGGLARWTEPEPGAAWQAIPSDSSPPLARSTIAGQAIDWVLDPSRKGIPARVSLIPRHRDGRPTAFTENGRLDFQTIRDLAVMNDRLLLATPTGVVVRDAQSFAFREVHAGPPVRALSRAFGPERLLARLADGRVVDWREQGLGDVDLRGTPGASSRVEMGAVTWSLPISGEPATGSGLTLTMKGSPVQWRPSQGGWLPEMDRVARLDRLASAERALVLGTGAGSWRLDPDNLRAFEPVPAVEPETIQGGHAALKVTVEAPLLTLQTPDGGPVFSQERFYFDVGGGLRGLGSSIHTLVPGRGLVGRDAASPQRILGYWPLDRQMPDRRPALAAEDGRLSLAFQSSSPSQRTRWLLTPEEGARWQRDPNPNRPERVEYGPVTWQGWRDGRSGFQAVVARDGRDEVLREWWSRDRFAWDDVRSVGVLGSHTVVALTPAGLVLWDQDSGSFLEADMILQSGLEKLLPARRQGRRAGLLATGSSGVFLLSAGESGRPGLTVVDSADYEHQTGLELARVAGEPEAFITLVERWSREDPRGSPGAALVSSIPDVESSHLLSNGQFVFDQGEAACPVAEGSFWAVHAPSGPRPLITFNQLLNPAQDGLPRLRLTRALPAPARFSAMRSHPEGFLAREDPGNWWLARVAGAEIRWSRLESVEKLPELRTGDQVALDVERLSWSATPRHLGDQKVALKVSPPGYPLFATLDQKTVLAFDGLTSISASPRTGSLALGTLGGVFTVPFTRNGQAVLNLQDPQARFTFRWRPSEGGAADWLADVREVRHDLDGTLYARFAHGLEVARQARDGTWTGAERMPEDENRGPRHRITVMGGRLLLDGRALVTSNDLPGGRRELTDIVGKAYDPDDNALWLATRNQGIFKLVLDRLLE